MYATLLEVQRCEAGFLLFGLLGFEVVIENQWVWTIFKPSMLLRTSGLKVVIRRAMAEVLELSYNGFIGLFSKC